MTVTINFDENTVPIIGDLDSRPLISIIVLTYGNRDFVDACLDTLAQQTWKPLEILFVDNASRDDSAAVGRAAMERLELPGRVMALEQNLGCAGGNNVGWRAAAGEVIVFLNPDTELQPDCIEQLVLPLLEDEKIGVTGAKMYFPGGRIIQHAGGIVHPNGMTNHHGAGREDNGEWDVARDVDYVTGAALAMRRGLMEKVGGFDEDYFPAYYEEVDLCLRVRRAGFRVVYIPTAVLVHHESVSVGKESGTLHRLFPRMRVRYLIKNLTLRQLTGWALPFEYKWMRREPGARGYRWFQVWYGWLGNFPWLVKWMAAGGRKSRDRGCSKLAR
jgi:GT2 family glycosyltransferase